MAKPKRRRVDIVSPQINYLNEEDKVFDFEKILESIDKEESRYKGKFFEFRIIKKKGNLIWGIVETNQNKEIPPKKNRRSGQVAGLNINPEEESLLFANVFLYDKDLNVLIYEINKDGCFLNQFKEAIYKILKNKEIEIPVDINFNAILKKDAFYRALNMDNYKKFEFEVVKPTELEGFYSQKEMSMAEQLLKCNINNAIHTNAESFTIGQNMKSRSVKELGINKDFMNSIISEVRHLLQSGKRQNIETAKIFGYMQDSDSKQRPIDLLTDTFDEFFTIDEVTVHSNIQVPERREGILRLYNKIKHELEDILRG